MLRPLTVDLPSSPEVVAIPVIQERSADDCAQRGAGWILPVRTSLGAFIVGSRPGFKTNSNAVIGEQPERSVTSVLMGASGDAHEGDFKPLHQVNMCCLMVLCSLWLCVSVVVWNLPMINFSSESTFFAGW